MSSAIMRSADRALVKRKHTSRMDMLSPEPFAGSGGKGGAEEARK
jgi:hypothetical protein